MHRFGCLRPGCWTAMRHPALPDQALRRSRVTGRPSLLPGALGLVLAARLQVVVPDLAYVLVAVGFLLLEHLLVGRIAGFLDELRVLGRRVGELHALRLPFLADRALVVHQRLRIADAVL